MRIIFLIPLLALLAGCATGKPEVRSQKSEGAQIAFTEPVSVPMIRMTWDNVLTTDWPEGVSEWTVVISTTDLSLPYDQWLVRLMTQTNYAEFPRTEAQEYFNVGNMLVTNL